MSEAFFSDATRQWQALLQQSAGPWAEWMRAGAQPPNAFEKWSALFGGNNATPTETIERFVQGARDYLSFLQAGMNVGGINAEGMSGWIEPLKRMFAAPDGMAGAFEHPFAKLWPGSAAGMNPFALGMSGFGQTAAPDLRDLKSWLKLPSFGPAREHQVNQQNAALAWFDYQQQIQRHNELMLRAAKRGFELFEGKLSEREQPGRQIESLRALYDLWVDAIEEAYADIALSQEYREVYGDLVNAQMRVRSHVQKEVERLSSDMGVPTRSEIDSIGERLQALRREVRGLRGGDALIDEIADLRGELETLARNAVRQALGERAKTSAQVAAAPSVARVDKPRAAATKPKKQSAKTAPARVAPEKAAPRRAAAAASGGFATRIAQFADASLGGKRKARGNKAAPAKSSRGAKAATTRRGKRAHS
ncbi:MAG: class III poly(R)-hydroxyalkanoic acid synthase subunit PhaE [Dokdonella sp.]|uniref:class III poly(R)-hydroxyalkanoic acid synthase subunit PhaE n=1 Tax=Dokdonella sp. TaxID=2291710 RepID=UPI0025C705E3|nr:class III poly(R)-hydroxyalkanoic acid synthase subunit PhaE [Dokdonella sp.]MBZ0222551.1 class III poly(R)-hydroxyalkanoic acid synthase subunit PhaE [Dokdonella sp.]MCC7256139.1 class III poly(R)-hydroxyalkanoic acid synthase subunit PhaE [Dokdonella sp.]